MSVQSVRLNHLDSGPCEQPVRLLLLRTICPARCRFFIEEFFPAPGRLDPLTFHRIKFPGGRHLPCALGSRQAMGTRSLIPGGQKSVRNTPDTSDLADKRR